MVERQLNADADASTEIIQLLGCAIHVAPWLIEHVGRIAKTTAPARTYAVITDAQVGAIVGPAVVGSLRHYAPHSRTILTSIAPGEQHKTRESWGELTDWMLSEECTRSTTVIALGGGVVTDLAGFVAATFMRGVPVIQVPTSLLAMVDASVGGKVGVDTRLGKNLVGAFHQPSAVVVDPVVLQTLPVEHRRGGMAEVLKHGIIADRDYLRSALSLADALLDGAAMEWHGAPLTQLIARSIAIKAHVVAGDEREMGMRHILNYGHTTAHALEAATNFEVPHGDAVSIGMMVEAVIAERIGRASRGMADEIRQALEQCGLPTVLPPTIEPVQLIELMRRDKKSRTGELVFALPSEVGRMAGADEGYAIPVEAAVVLTALQSVAS